MEGVVTHFLADAERTVGLEFIFADCTKIRRSMEQSGVVINVQICIGFEFRSTQSLSSVVCLDSRKFW
jgi:hypothetical protein